MTNPNACLNDSDGDGIVDVDWTVCAQTQTIDDASHTIMSEEDTDYLGYGIVALGDVDGGGLSDFLMSAPHSENTSLGYALLFLGEEVGTEGDYTTADAAYRFTSPKDRTGKNMGSVGDVDGDGLNDFFIGAQNYTSGTGTTYLILGGSLGLPGDYYLPDVAAYSFNGAAQGDIASIHGTGDVDGNGLDDFIMGGGGYNNNPGDAYLFLSLKILVCPESIP